METFNNLPLFTMDVDGDITTEEGVSFVALVDRPAIKRTFLAFADAAAAHMAFTITSEDRRIVSGPLMLADTPILRKPPQVPESCYITFPAPAIERIVRKFFCQGNQGKVNLMHDPDQQVEDVTMFESFISDSSRGILPMAGYEDAPEGSWFGSFHVNNDEVWASIKDGTFKGFSVEGLFARLIPAADAVPEIDDQEFDEEELELLRDIYGLLKNVE
jgi:hypothetical protein